MDIVRTATHLHEECVLLNAKVRNKNRRGVLVKWQPPPANVVKINVDGGWFERLGFGGIGVVVRDHNGDFLAAKALRVESVMDIEHLEARAMLVGVDFACELGYDRVVFEGDSKQIIDKLKSKSSLFTPVGVLLHDINCATMAFASFCFSHVKRDGNSVAHSLCREIFENLVNVWRSIAPTSIMPLLMADLA